MIASCYFSTVPDPQRKSTMITDNVTYIRKWVESVSEGIIFHDNLSKEFTSWFPKIKFIKVPSPDIDLYKYRWLVYFDYLLEHPEIKDIFFTDVSDSYMVLKPEPKPGILYCGDEETDFAKWLINAATPTLKSLPRFDELYERQSKLLNPGILGGTREVVIDFLALMCKIINDTRHADKEILGDMALFNYIAFMNFKVFHGYPINSKYRMNEVRNDVWFIHK